MADIKIGRPTMKDSRWLTHGRSAKSPCNPSCINMHKELSEIPMHMMPEIVMIILPLEK